MKRRVKRIRKSKVVKGYFGRGIVAITGKTKTAVIKTARRAARSGPIGIKLNSIKPYSVR